MRVRAKYSCGTPEPFSAPDRASTPTMSLIIGGKQQNVALALVIPLRMKLLYELDQRASLRGFAEQDQFRQALLLHRTYSFLSEGV